MAVGSGDKQGLLCVLVNRRKETTETANEHLSCQAILNCPQVKPEGAAKEYGVAR